MTVLPHPPLRLLAVLFLPLAWLTMATAQVPLPKPPKLPPLRKTPVEQPAATHPFAGTFANASIVLALGWDEAAQRYSGTLTYAGESMPCSGSEQGGRLVGTYVDEGETWDFTVEAQGATFVLTSDGERHELARRDRPTPPATAAATGGVGILFQPDENGRFVVAQLTPGGPAEACKVPVGGILRAVDDKRVDGLSLEQVRDLVMGPVGTMVVLTIETEGRSTPIVLQRAALDPNAATRGPRPTPGDAPPGLPAPNGTAGAYPDWLQPGVRVTYYGGSASLPGVRSQLVEHAEGGWVDSSGRRYREEEVMGTGGAGLTQYDFVNVTRDCLAASMTMFVFAGAQLETVSRTLTQGVVGDPNGFTDVWLPPARLRAMEERQSPGLTILRLQYPLGGRTYDAVTTQTTSQTGYTRYTYDLESGLLLAYSSSSVGSPVVTPLGDTSTTGSGSTTITTVQLRNVRAVQVPWAGQRPPRWLQPGRLVHLAGTYATSLGGELAAAPFRFDAQITVDHRVGDCLIAKLATRLDFGNGMGQDAESLQVYGPASIGSLFLDPSCVQRMQPGQVLDQDPLTGWQVTFAGSDGRYATIFEQGSLEQQSYTYDLQNGALVATSMRQQVGPATNLLDLQLQGN
ncbi:MAG: hypothetical protein JNM25_05890 [Planctomycetes bacterium]|nr:hypothetical protein [Planctomycetota bacterium]